MPEAPQPKLCHDLKGTKLGIPPVGYIYRHATVYGYRSRWTTWGNLKQVSVFSLCKKSQAHDVVLSSATLWPLSLRGVYPATSVG